MQTQRIDAAPAGAPVARLRPLPSQTRLDIAERRLEVYRKWSVAQKSIDFWTAAHTRRMQILDRELAAAIKAVEEFEAEHGAPGVRP